MTERSTITDAVWLMVRNERNVREAWERKAQDLADIADQEDQVRSGVWTPKEFVRINLAEKMQYYYELKSPFESKYLSGVLYRNLGDDYTMYMSFMQAAIGLTDWNEVAQDFMEGVDFGDPVGEAITVDALANIVMKHYNNMTYFYKQVRDKFHFRIQDYDIASMTASELATISYRVVSSMLYSDGTRERIYGDIVQHITDNATS